MGRRRKKPKPKVDKVKLLVAIASIITAITAFLSVILDFIIKLLSLGR